MENTPTDPLVEMSRAGGEEVEKGLDKIAKIAMIIFAVFFVITAILLAMSNANNAGACQIAFEGDNFRIPPEDIQDFSTCMFYCNKSTQDQYRIGES